MNIFYILYILFKINMIFYSKTQYNNIFQLIDPDTISPRTTYIKQPFLTIQDINFELVCNKLFADNMIDINIYDIFVTTDTILDQFNVLEQLYVTVNNDSVNNDTVNKDTVNNDTVNKDTVNKDTVNNDSVNKDTVNNIQLAYKLYTSIIQILDQLDFDVLADCEELFNDNLFYEIIEKKQNSLNKANALLKYHTELII